MSGLPAADGNRKPQGSKRAVFRANKGEGSHMGSYRRGIHRARWWVGIELFKKNRPARKKVRAADAYPKRKPHLSTTLSLATKTHGLTGGRKQDPGWEKRTPRVVGGEKRT